MAAFEKINSGIPDLDKAYNYIRLGDNVVWQVGKLQEFTSLMHPFVDQAIKDHRNLIYVRFAAHPPLLTPREGLKIVEIPLSHRFETFTVSIHNLIEQEGKDAFYVFDCLSELQTAWSTDLMMGNFFRLTCPFLFILDTVAYFPIIRGKHSFEAIAKIRDTTQLFSDVYSDESCIYVRPLKVWNRYSETMAMPHRYIPETGSFQPLMDGVDVSRFYQAMNHSQALSPDQNIDSWERFFSLTMQMRQQGMDVTAACDRMCNIMMSRDEKMREMIKANFTPEDYFEVKNRQIGTGLIGGKACGMLLARKIIQNHRPDLYAHMEPHDSFYIGSDVFYSYIVFNNFWDIRIRQRTKEEYFSLAPTFADCLMKGEFSGTEKEAFRRLLDYYGPNPIIVRSSSILEDGFGNAFAGKYESVFCANTGTPEERLAEFEQAIRIVYASTMSQSALDYRLRRGLDQRDEQMALLVQRVSGSFYENFFMPCAAGVGYSYSPYKFVEDIDQNAGMLRLVMGLGTGAVDRTTGSYPRLVSLDKPRLTAATTIKDKHQYSQRKVDVINTLSGQVEHWDFEKVAEKIPGYLRNLLLEHDFDAERMFRERGQRKDICFVSCEGLVRKEELMHMMQGILSKIQETYDYPVDIEYTINVSKSGEFVVNLLQCRPLQVANDQGSVALPAAYDPEKVLLSCKGASMGLSSILHLDYVLYVDPIAYYQLPYKEKFKVSRAIHDINWALRGQEKTMLLLVPGRIGTSSPELGVPTAFADISEFAMICEISETKAGYMPELSYGSHIFQDLVEAGILYTAIFGNETTKIWQPELLKKFPDKKEAFCQPEPAAAEVLSFYEVSNAGMTVYHDITSKEVLIHYCE